MVNGQRLSVSFIIFTQLCGNKRGPNLVNKNETCAASQIKSGRTKKKELWLKPATAHTERERERDTRTLLHIPDSSGHPFFGEGGGGAWAIVRKATWGLFLLNSHLLHARACACMSLHVCACVRLSKLTVTRSHLANVHVVNNASLPFGKILCISCSVCKLCNYNQFCAKLANKFWSNNCTHSHSATPPRPTGQASQAFGWPKAQTSFHELAMKSN